VYENFKQPLMPRREFLLRLMWHILLVAGALFLWLAIGMLGYGLLDNMSLIDAFLNAAMIAGGMGPVDILTNDGAKLFAGLYAIVSGIIIIAAAGVILAPILHRLLHTLHLDDLDTDGSSSDS
jgi:hypothetical protein